MDISKQRIRQSAAVSTLALAFMVAYGQTAGCDSTYPQCSDTISTLNGTTCDNDGTWTVTQDTIDMFVCDNWYSGCGGSGGSGICNVLVQFTGPGYIVTCSGTGQSYFCFSGQPSATANLNKNCAGGPCSVPGGSDITPSGYPPAPSEFLEEADPYDNLPAPPPFGD